MTRTKIAVTLPPERLAEAKRAVAEGRATSVSAYVADAMAAHGEREGLRLYVDALIEEFGKPTAADYAWADEQIAKSQRRRST